MWQLFTDWFTSANKTCHSLIYMTLAWCSFLILIDYKISSKCCWLALWKHNFFHPRHFFEQKSIKNIYISIVTKVARHFFVSIQHIDAYRPISTTGFHHFFVSFIALIQRGPWKHQCSNKVESLQAVIEHLQNWSLRLVLTFGAQKLIGQS